MSDRDEHLAWARRRALAYVDAGELHEAATSMMSDLNKHPELSDYDDALDVLAILYVRNGDAPGMRRWIEGFR